MKLVGSANDLKPESLMEVRRTGGCVRSWQTKMDISRDDNALGYKYLPALSANFVTKNSFYADAASAVSSIFRSVLVATDCARLSC